MRFYHVDLQAQLGTRRLTWRRLAVLLSHLPRESAYVQSVVGDTVRWGDTEHLLASLIDTVRQGNFYTAIAASNRQLSDPPKPPDPIPRPGDKQTEPKRSHGMTREQFDEFLRKWRMGELQEGEITKVEVT